MYGRILRQLRESKGRGQAEVARSAGISPAQLARLESNQRGLYLEDLFVLPEWRGRGAGRALLTYLARVARDRNCGRLEWTVLDWNEPAIRFYKSLGAVPMDQWTVYRVAGDALEKLADEGRA